MKQGRSIERLQIDNKWPLFKCYRENGGNGRVKCLTCKKEFAADSEPNAAISIFVAGDEYTYSYWKCKECSFYTVESYHDRFLGAEDEAFFLPPFSEEEGDRCVELVRACPSPFNKSCQCASHDELYYGTPRGSKAES